MKMTKILSLVLALIMVTACFAACGKKDNNGGNTNIKYDFTVWVSEVDGSVALAEKQIAAFQAAQGTNYKIKVEGLTEADAASKVVADVASAPDIYCFAQDQLARLVQASALQAPSDATKATLESSNDADSIRAASNGGKLWAYPMTSDNGYYLYYDKTVVNDPSSMEAIIADCIAAGKLFRYALENAWYTASFFFATGCHSTWTMDETGEFNAVDDNFNSEAGLIAMKGMQKLAQSSCYESDNNKIMEDTGAVVTGIWAANDAVKVFGANLGVAKLPSFEIDGESYQLGSYAGFKLMGVKPQTTVDRAKFVEALALYLTNEQSQLDRYDVLQWGPSNKAAQANEKVQANVSLAALREQNKFAVVQGQIHGSWWDIAKVLGADAKNATEDAMLQEALDKYDAAIAGLLNMTDEQKQAWGVIGNICGTTWDQDFALNKVSDNVYESEALELHQGEEFKVRQGASWDVNFGRDGFNGQNFVVEADGTYVVRFTLISETEATVQLIVQE